MSDYKELSESLSKENEELEIRVDYLDKQLEEAKKERKSNDEQRVELQKQLETLLRIHGGKLALYYRKLVLRSHNIVH